jgi:hypothetical protein
MNLPALKVQLPSLLGAEASGSLELDPAVLAQSDELKMSGSSPVAEVTARLFHGLRDRRKALEFSSRFKGSLLDLSENDQRDSSLAQFERPRLAPSVPNVDLIRGMRRQGLTVSFSPVQEWEGYVRSIGNESFIADLIDLTSGVTRVTEQAEIPLQEISEVDLGRLRPGSIFRWAIGYQRTRSGSKMRISQIVFRDLPKWTKTDFHEAKVEAEEIAKFAQAGIGNQGQTFTASNE